MTQSLAKWEETIYGFRIDLLGNDNKQTGWIFRNLCNY